MCASGGGANGLVAFEATFKFTAQDRDENWVGIVAQVKNASRCRHADDAHKWWVAARPVFTPLFLPHNHPPNSGHPRDCAPDTAQNTMLINITAG